MKMSDQASPAPNETSAVWLQRHRSHDVPWLLQRWQDLARNCPGLTGGALLKKVGDFEVPYFRHSPAPDRPHLYVSAGIHGDEPAATLGLLWWAEESLLDCPCAVTLLPCLNPWGLSQNSRYDASGTDLNRCFDDPRQPLIGAWDRFVDRERYDVTLCLHEDYDAVGAYCYELPGSDPGVAAGIFADGWGDLPLDLRPEIDGMDAHGGVISPRRNLPTTELPEALRLFGRHTPLSLTFETPSEFGLYERAKAQRDFIRGVIQHLSGKSA